jgi:serine phosphatase RsbU (regulator of sigma subunit)
MPKDARISRTLLPSTPGTEHRARGLDLTFRAKLLLGTCGLVVLTGGVIAFVADRSNRASTQGLVDSLFREVSSHAATQTKDFVLRAAPVAESLEQLSDQGLALDDLDRLAHQLLAFLKGNPGMTWVLYGSESGEYVGATRQADDRLHIKRTRIVDGRAHLTEFEVQSDGSWNVFQRDENYGYDSRNRPYYLLAKEKGKLAWTTPFMFFTQGVPGISCVIPVKNSAGRLRGVFSVEFDLNALSEFVGGLSISEHSRVFLFTPDETLLAHPNQQDLQGKGVKGKGALLTLADTGDPLVDAFRQHLDRKYLSSGASVSVSSSATDGFHFFEFNHDGVGYLASTTVFPIGDGQSWIVGAVAPESDFLAAAWRTRWNSLIVAAAALGVALLLAAMLARRISGPVQALIVFMQRVGGGDLEARADFHGSREFRQLSDALNRMIADLRDRLRLRHSLDVAMDVQQQLLPKRPPTIRGFDVAGHSTYCDETGGDYYDFLVVDQPTADHLLIALGDVMGHGVAAALVMAGTRAVLRDRADATGCLADLMGRLNRMIAADLEGSRFMTMHLGVMDVRQKTYRWVSAGHDPAMIYDPVNDSFEEPDASSMPLGIMDDTVYEEHVCGPLQTGQIFVLGTDGVWEMPNSDGELFGKPRLRQAIQAAREGTSEQIAQTIRDALAKFRGDAKPVDDVTFVVVKAVASEAA